MGEILLIAADWQFRALVRAQLLEEGYQVRALPSLQVAATRMRSGGRSPRTTVLDAQGLAVNTETLSVLVRLAGEGPIVVCCSLLNRRRLAQVAALPARVLHRPFSVGDVVKEVQKLTA